jgi:capsule biosynthesis phosphatase
MLRGIASKCTEEERRYLNDLYTRVSAFEMDLALAHERTPTVPKRLCFDVDGVTAKGGFPYDKCVPYDGVVERIKKLKAAGHTIIFQTARYMAKCDGDQAKARLRGYQELKWWLQENDIPFDEIYFGKASADMYSDDRGCRIESELGNTHWETSFASTLNRTMSKHADLPIQV